MRDLDQTYACFTAAIARHIRPEYGPIGIAVSGGSDSLALLLLAHRWSVEANTELVALTVDHGLRSEAADEAAYAASICKQLGAAHQTLHWQNPKATQAAARRGRHALLAEALRLAGGRFLLTGHTQDDQAETFLIRARAGSGWYGLAGMTEVAVSPVWPEGRGIQIVRPLLAASRFELKQVVSEAGWHWIDDPSNQDPKYERVRVRALLAGDEALRASVLRNQARLRVLRANSDQILAAWLLAHVSADTDGLVRADMQALEPSLHTRALSLLIQAASGSERPPRGEGLARIAAAILQGVPMPGQTLGGAWLRKRDEKLHIARDPGMAGEAGQVGARLTAFAAALGGPLFAHVESCQERESFFRVKAPMYD